MTQNILRDMLTVDVLNNFNDNGVPPHTLKLKIGDICIVMRNMARKEGLTNNTRVQITKISKFCIRVQTLSAEPKVFFIPRIRFKFRLPFGQSFQLLRTQFPLRLACCISTNKHQGQEYDYSLSDLIQTSFRSWTSIFQRPRYE
jgi:PIF1-like helicase